MEVDERVALDHITVQEGSGEGKRALGGGGSSGHIQAIQRLWDPLEIMNSFRYLGQVILAADNNCPMMVRNLSHARAVRKSMTRILRREGVEPRVSGFFFKAVVQ